jgi:hypothetical protein
VIKYKEETRWGDRLILVEGPDGAGKTTLVNRLAKEFDLTIGERSAPNRDELWKSTVEDTFKALAHAVRGRKFEAAWGSLFAGDPVFIWDRLFYSEFVYAGITPRPVQFNDEQAVHVARMIDALNCPVILCLPPREVVITNVMGPGRQMAGVVDRIEHIYDEYRGLLDGWKFPALPGRTLVWDYTGEVAYCTYEEIQQEVTGYLLARKNRSWT